MVKEMDDDESGCFTFTSAVAWFNRLRSQQACSLLCIYVYVSIFGQTFEIGFTIDLIKTPSSVATYYFWTEQTVASNASGIQASTASLSQYGVRSTEYTAASMQSLGHRGIHG